MKITRKDILNMLGLELGDIITTDVFKDQTFLEKIPTKFEVVMYKGNLSIKALDVENQVYSLLALIDSNYERIQ